MECEEKIELLSKIKTQLLIISLKQAKIHSKIRNAIDEGTEYSQFIKEYEKLEKQRLELRNKNYKLIIEIL